MKRIRAVAEPTPGLRAYLDSVDHANWGEFGSHDAGRSLHELHETLVLNQHELCACCEIEIKQRRQIEHVIPRSDEVDGRQRALDVTNMIACCLGGTKPVYGLEKHEREDYFRRPVPDNMSCGQAKEDLNDKDFIDPRRLPALPPLVRVGNDGLIEVDTDACQAARFDPDRLTRVARAGVDQEPASVSAVAGTPTSVASPFAEARVHSSSRSPTVPLSVFAPIANTKCRRTSRQNSSASA